MRSYKKVSARGFTLVELMIVVAIIGVLASLAIYGVKKYLASAKSAEARNNLGAINRGSIAAYERETAAAELIGLGANGTATTHQLCGSATQPVPNAKITNQKYQPNNTPAGKTDFTLGSSTVGWPCLKFQVDSPMQYELMYNNGATHALTPDIAAASLPAAGGWSGEAAADTDGNGTSAEFLLAGNVQSGQAYSASTIAEFQPDE